jgi:DNA-binding CsgD family transcriptional regulator
VRLARAEGDPRAAARLHHGALALRAAMGDPPGVAASLEALGALAVFGDRAGPGVRLWGAARAIRERHGCPRSSEPDDYEMDVAAAREAMAPEEFAAHWARGAALSHKQALALAARLGGRGARLGHGWEALTRAECQVVELVAEGLTNAQIARRLSLSPRTVHSHLRRIFAKLGVTNRAALTKEACRR